MKPDARRLELVKALALVAMLADHIDLALFDRSLPALHALGQFAFPAFCLSFGIGIAASSDPLRSMDRLVLPAIAAQFAWFVIRPAHPGNVLFVFALCAVAAALAARSRAAGAAALAGVVVLGAGVLEGGPYGPLLAACGYAAGRAGVGWPALAGGLAWALLAPSVGALVAAVAVPLAAGVGPILRKVPALPWVYAGHLAALAAVLALGATQAHQASALLSPPRAAEVFTP